MGLFNAVVRVETESAMEDSVAGLCLFDQVGEDPICKTIQAIVVFEEVFDEVAGFEAGIVEQISVRNGQIPFGEIDGNGQVKFLFEQFDLIDRFAEGIFVHIELRVGEGVGSCKFGVVKGKVVVIEMQIQEIRGTIVLLCEGKIIADIVFWHVTDDAEGSRTES